MSRDIYRRIGAIGGLVLGIILMRMLVQSGMFDSGIIPMAIFGAGGTVIGGILAERFYGFRKVE